MRGRSLLRSSFWQNCTGLCWHMVNPVTFLVKTATGGHPLDQTLLSWNVRKLKYHCLELYQHVLVSAGQNWIVCSANENPWCSGLKMAKKSRKLKQPTQTPKLTDSVKSSLFENQMCSSSVVCMCLKGFFGLVWFGLNSFLCKSSLKNAII